MTSETNKGVMDAFFTRGKANEGLELPLYLPTGEKSEHWLRILGIDSDAFRAADAMARRGIMQIAALGTDTDRAEAIASSKRQLVASLVIAWSFPEECTPENVAKFFVEAPQIMDAVDTAASRRALFFGARSSSSQPSQEASSSST